jgi:hypothetical protein
MPDAVEPLDQLVARANTAIAEARRLFEANRELQRLTAAMMHRLYFRATFHPKTVKLYSPYHLPEQ